MARLEYEITGNITGLASAADGVKGILNNLQVQADKLNIKLFGAETQADIEAIGGALTIVTGKINEYTTAAIQGSQAFKDQSAQSALDALSTKISVLTGNAQLFGESIKNQQAQIAAYQQALNKILAQGFDPLDQRIVPLTANIDRLTASIEAQKAAAKTYVDPFAKFQTTGSLIKDAESKVRSLSLALRDATNTRDIAQYNVRLTEAQKGLEALKNTGVQTATATSAITKALGEVEQSGGSSLASLGKRFTGIYSVIRQAAYILPGIGIAGIFNLAFEGITAAAVALDLFNTKSEKTKEQLKAIADQEKEQYGESGFVSSAVKLSELTEKVKLAKDGFLDKKKVLDEYNSTLGLTIGQVSNLNDAEQKIIDNGPKYLQFLLLKAKAEYAFKQAAESSYKIDVENDKITSSKGVTNADAGQFFGPNKTPLIDPNKFQLLTLDQLKQKYDSTSKPITDNIEKVNTAQKNLGLSSQIAAQKQVDSLTKVQTQAQKVAAQTQKQLEDFAKANGFNVYSYANDKVKKAPAPEGINDAAFDNQLTNILNSSNASANKSDKTGLALDIQTIKDKYVKLYADLQNLDDKRDASAKISDKQRVQDEAESAAADIQLRLNETKEIADATIKDQERTALEVQRIRDEFGVKSTQTRAREIAAINTLADSEIIKAQGNAAKLKAIDEGRTVAIQAVNDKYTLIVSQTYDKINDIVAQGNANQIDTEARKVAKINVQYDKLIQQANKYYAELKVLQAGGDASLQGRDLNAEQQSSDNQLQKARALQISIVLSATFSQALQSSINTFANDFYSSIVNLGKTREDIDTKYAIQLENATDQNSKDQINKLRELEQATTTSFTAIFSSLVSKFNQSFSQSLVQSFVKKLTDGFGDTLISSSIKVDPAVSIANAGVSFSQAVIAAGQAFAVAATGGSVNLVTAGNLAKTDITTGGSNAESGMSKGAANLAAAATVAGSVISGLGKPTNSTTSALGGALSGAGEGALIGSAIAPGIGTAIGAVAGGIVGLVGGLFSASKARKQLEEQQLEQQKQQTELLRQSVAYTSAIIGRNTTNGVISGITVGAFGNLVATVSGKDLQFILDRNAKTR